MATLNLFDDIAPTAPTAAPVASRREPEPGPYGHAIPMLAGKLAVAFDPPEPVAPTPRPKRSAARIGTGTASLRKPKPSGGAALAVRLRALAAKMSPAIDNALRPFTQNHTPKRGKEYAKRLHDGHDMQRAQRALRALADAHERGDVPPVLAGVNSKAQVLRMTATRVDCSGGYYSYVETGEPHDTSDAAEALRNLAGGAADDAAAVAHSKQEATLQDIRNNPVPGFFPTPAASAITKLPKHSSHCHGACHDLLVAG